MVKVPANQAIEKVLSTKVNHSFVAKAESLSPNLHTWLETPKSVIGFVPDASKFFKCRAEHLASIEELSSLEWSKGADFILDFETHRVGYFSFHLHVNGLNADAPCRLRLVFGEVPYDVTEELHPCETWISTSWLPDETINVDWLPTDVVLPRRYSFRYVRIQVLDTSPK
jgi:alpha-L-rhamnosidase